MAEEKPFWTLIGEAISRVAEKADPNWVIGVVVIGVVVYYCAKPTLETVRLILQDKREHGLKLRMYEDKVKAALDRKAAKAPRKPQQGS